MTVVVRIEIACNKCGARQKQGMDYIILAPSGDDVRKWAAINHGWIEVEGKDICPKCQSTTGRQ